MVITNPIVTPIRENPINPNNLNKRYVITNPAIRYFRVVFVKNLNHLSSSVNSDGIWCRKPKINSSNQNFYIFLYNFFGDGENHSSDPNKSKNNNTYCQLNCKFFLNLINFSPIFGNSKLKPAYSNR